MRRRSRHEGSAGNVSSSPWAHMIWAPSSRADRRRHACRRPESFTFGSCPTQRYKWGVVTWGVGEDPPTAAPILDYEGMTFVWIADPSHAGAQAAAAAT